MKTIFVEPAVLQNSAAAVDDLKSQYQDHVSKLYQYIEVMSSSWQGSDNLAFVNQIQGYYDDFQRIGMVLSQYSDFLKRSAIAYQQTQQELASMASKLTN